MLAVQSINRVALSPDASRVLVVTRVLDFATNAVVSKAIVADTSSRSELRMMPPQAVHAEWASDSRSLTYLRADENCTRIEKIALDADQSSPPLSPCLLPRGRELTEHRWSPNGNFLAYIARSPAIDQLETWDQRAKALAPQESVARCLDPRSAEGRARGMDSLDLSCAGTSVGTGWMWGLDVASPALRYFATVDDVLPPAELWLMNLSTGLARRVSAATSDVRQFEWSSLGHELSWVALERNAKRDSDVFHTPGIGSSLAFGGRLAFNWLNTEKADAIPQSTSFATISGGDLYSLFVRRSPDGSMFAYGTGSVLTVFAVVGLREPSEPREIFNGRYRSVEWSSDSRSLYVTRYGDQKQTLVSVDARSGRVRNILANPFWHGTPSLSADRSRFALTVEDVVEPPRVYFGNVESTSLREIVGHAELNPHWKRIKPLTYERFTWRSWDGLWQLSGVLVAAGSTRSQPPPAAIILIRGAGAPTDLQFGLDDQQPVLPLAAEGFTVFIPNTRGRSGVTTHGYDDLSRERTYFSKPWRDVMQSVDLLIEQGAIDAERLGLMGFSYGGGLAGWGITQTARFKAAVLKEPVALDMAGAWRTMWGHPDYGRDTIGKKFNIDNPYEGPGKAFIEHESPISNVGAVRTPTLLEFGAKSGNALTGGNSFYHGLVSFGVPAELVMYPRTIHGFEEPTIIADSFRRELEWLARWVPRVPRRPAETLQ